MVSPWEISANILNATSILLAGRNSAHTWWTGIVGCALFTNLFYSTRLYADATLQLFFIGTSLFGWWHWRQGRSGIQRPVQTTSPAIIAALCLAGATVALGYGALLHRFTDAYAPFMDSMILAFSVLGQFLLVGRRIETWWCWLLVNTIAVPLFASRGLYLTAALYTGFWINAVVALFRWRKIVVP